MQQNCNDANNNNTKSIIYMMVDALSYSLIPVLAALGSTSVSGIPYLGYSLVLAAATYFIFIKFRYPTLNIPKTKKILAISFLAGLTFAGSQFALIASIHQAANSYFPTVVFQIYPIFIILFVVLLKLSKEALSIKKSIVMLVSLLGVAFLYYDSRMIEDIAMYAILLPIFSAALLGLSVSLVINLTKLLENEGLCEPLAPIFSNYLSRLFSLLIFLPVMVVNEIFYDGMSDVISLENVVIIAINGVFCMAIGSIFYFRALQLTTKSLSIHMISYLSIVLAVLWLWLLDIDEVTPLILIGSGYVLVSNILLNFNLEKNYAYNGTIIWILSAGSFIYFTNGWQLDSYYDAITVPIFFFAITLAFLIDRLTKSRALEEGYILEFISNIIKSKPDKVNEYSKYVLDMGCAKNYHDLHYAYTKLCVNDLGKKNRILLNNFIVSRIKGIKYSEVFVLIITGFLSISIALLYRPVGFVYDIFSLILTTAIVFNLLYINDKHNERSTRFLEIRGEGDSIYPEIIFDSELTLNGIEKHISSILLAAVIVIFCLVFYMRHGVF